MSAFSGEPPTGRVRAAWPPPAPPPSHHPWIRVLLVVSFLGCVVLDGWGLLVLASSPSLGGQLVMEGQRTVVVGLAPQGALARMGLREGEALVSVAGQPLPPQAFAVDPDEFLRWQDRERVAAFQAIVYEEARRGSVQLTLALGEGVREVVVPADPMGLARALERSLPMRVVAWAFLLVAMLVWRRLKNETTAVNLLGGLVVFASWSTTATLGFRDLVLPPTALAWLEPITYWSSEGGILTLHLALVFPLPLKRLQRQWWLRLIPWGLYGVQGVIHSFHLLPGPIYTNLPLLSLALLSFMGIATRRVLRAEDPLERAQLLWVALGAVLGFLPWVLLSALPVQLGYPGLPSSLTLLASVAVPFSLAFAIFRYRLLDVRGLIDWVVVHGVLITGAVVLEALVVSTADHYLSGNETYRQVTVLVVTAVLLLAYAPLRSWLFDLTARVSGKVRTPTTTLLNSLLSGTRATGNPIEALELTLRRTFPEATLHWLEPGSDQDALLEAVSAQKEAVLGFELGEACPVGWAGATITPVQGAEGPLALVLERQDHSPWLRSDLELLGALVHAVEPLMAMEAMRRSHARTEASLREQREDVLRELHDGLGSQLFGISLLSQPPEQLDFGLWRTRMNDLSTAAGDAMDTLRTGLTVLGAAPEAFTPMVLSLLMRAERTLGAAGISMRIQMEDELASLKLPTRQRFNLLRSLQEALTNAGRHSHCRAVVVSVRLEGGNLTVEVEDDGVGFLIAHIPAGRGLRNIQQRLESIGGTATFDSAPGQGTRVRLSVPYAQK